MTCAGEVVEIAEPAPGQDARRYNELVLGYADLGYVDEPKTAGLVSHLATTGLLSARGRVVEGNRVGHWFFYHETGSLRAIERYQEQPWVSVWFYWSDGSVRSRGSRDESGRVGEWVFYDATGALVQRATYGRKTVDVQAYGGRDTLLWAGQFVRGSSGEFRHGSFRDADGLTEQWDLGARVMSPPAPSDSVRCRLLALDECDRPRWLRNLFHVEPSALSEYLELLIQAAPGVPVPTPWILGLADGCVTWMAQGAYLLSPEQSRLWLCACDEVVEDLERALVDAWNDKGQGCVAVLRWLCDRSPQQPAAVLAAALEHPDSSVRRIAARAACACQDGVRLLCQGLASDSPGTRELCATNLRRLAEVSSRDSISNALCVESVPAIRAVLEEALASIRIVASEVSDAQLDALLGARGEPGIHHLHSTVHTRGGHRMSPAAIHGYVLRLKQGRTCPVVQAVRGRLSDGDCAALLDEICAGVPSDQPSPWMIHAAAVLGDDDAMDVMGRSIQDRTTPSAKKVLDALAHNPTGSSLLWLARWASGTLGRKRSIRAHAQVRMQEVSQALGLDDDDIEDLRVACPDLGRDGGRSLGSGCALISQADGALVLRSENPDVVPARRVQRRFEKLSALVVTGRRRTLRQLEHAMVLGRRWPRQRFVELFAARRPLRPDIEEVLFSSGDRLFCLEQGNPVDENGGRLCLEHQVGVVHPMDLTDQQRSTWSHLRPAFPQLNRVLYADVPATLEVVFKRYAQEPLRGSIGPGCQFMTGPSGLEVTGRAVTEKIIQEILLMARA